MIEAIKKHRSIRKFKPTPVAQDVLNEILIAASRASNTGNMQIYSIVITTQQDIKDQLCEKGHFNQPMVKQAPVVLTFCADLNRFNKWCNQRNADPGYDNFLSFYTASIDATIAAQNACTEAVAQGLGICYLGTTNYMAQNIIEILKLPQGVVPVTTVVLGYADENPPLTDRLPQQAIIHNETYSDYTDEDIDKIYNERESSDFTKSLIEENKTENLAQIFTQKRYTKANNIAFSKELLKVIEQQGFMNND